MFSAIPFKLSHLKVIYLSLALCLFHCTLQAIDLRVGVMAGVNSSLNQLYTYGAISKTDSKLGYNVNLFSRFKISSYIIQPEIGYQMNRIGIDAIENGIDKESNLNIGQAYISVLMGIKVSKLRFAIGPMLLFPPNQSFDAITSEFTQIQQLNSGRKNLGLIANVGLDISNRWSVDIRASRTFTQSEFNVVNQNSSFNFLGNTGVVSILVGYSLFKM